MILCKSGYLLSVRHSGTLRRIFRVILFVVLFVVSIPSFAQQTAEQYIVTMDYLQYLPDRYAQDTTKQWPVVIFLHGAGETGNDIEKVRGFGLSPLIEAGKKFPFIVISPQTKTPGWKSEDVRDLLVNDLFVKLRIDPDRVYLTGLSMGGAGTWSTAMNYPELFAAVIPICGWGNEGGISRLRNMPIWCFHGDMDEVIPVERSTVLINALKAINSQVKYTIYQGVGHESWTRTYANDSIYDWLLQHKRYKNVSIELDNEILNSYQGVYRVNEEEKYDIRFEVEDKGLREMYGDSRGRLWMPKSVNELYYEEYSPDFIRFEKDKNGNVTGYTNISYGEHFYRKILQGEEEK